MNILQVAQHADDLERAGAWYERLLGQPPAAMFDPPGLLFFTFDNTRLLLDRNAPSALIYFHLPDVRETVEELRSVGVEISNEPSIIFSHDDDTLGPAGTQEWMAFVRDSEGNAVGLVSRLPSVPDA